MKKENSTTRVGSVLVRVVVAAAVVAFFAVVLVVSSFSTSCGDSGKASPCSRVCAYARECWGEDGWQQCFTQCPAYVEEVEQAGYDSQAVADCFLEQATCMTLASDASMEALIWSCAYSQNRTDAGTGPGPDADIPSGHIAASEACTRIGHAYCNRRDDCLGERPPDVAHCRNDVTQACQTEQGTVLESEVTSCVDQIDGAACDLIFDATGSPVPQAGCPEY